MRRRFTRPGRDAVRLFMLGLVALGCGLHTRAFAEPDATTLIKLSTSVLKVEVIRAQGGYSLGSGVVIGADLVATNCHVTRDARVVSVLQAGLRLPARSQRVDAYHDLCLLNVPGIEGSRAVEFGQPTALAIGQAVTAIGHTAGALQGSSGVVIALHRMDGGRVVQSSNFFSSGASGGGLFDADSRLVGILTFRLRGADAHYFSTPVAWLARQRAGTAQDQPIEPLPRGEFAFWERPAEGRPAFLQAAALEAEGNWRALQPLAAEWAKRDADDPEPWYLLGLAFARQGLPREAHEALACSLEIEPDMALARSELERIGPRQDKPSQSHLAGACPH